MHIIEKQKSLTYYFLLTVKLVKQKMPTFENADILNNNCLLYYFPQHCLYFLPEPHARPLTIFCLYMVQIVLCVFPLFYGHLVHYIISIIYIINITNFICYVDKSWTKIILSQQFVYLHSLYTKF